MFIFPPGAGCTGVPKLVQPGDEMCFSVESEEKSQETEINSQKYHRCRSCQFEYCCCFSEMHV